MFSCGQQDRCRHERTFRIRTFGFLALPQHCISTQVTSKKFKFAENHNLEFSFVSAADGTNVVQVFTDAVRAALKFKQEGGDFMADVLDLLGEASTCRHGISFGKLAVRPLNP